MKRTIFLFFVIFISFISVACSQAPDNSVVESAIRKALREEVPPLLIGNMLGGSNAEIARFEILEKTYKKEKPNAFSAAFGARPRNYWLFDIRVKGTATVGGSDTISAMLSGGAVTKKDFDSRIKYRLYEQEDGSWYAKWY